MLGIVSGRRRRGGRQGGKSVLGKMVRSQSATLISIALLPSGASNVFGAFAARLSPSPRTRETQKWLNVILHSLGRGGDMVGLFY